MYIHKLTHDITIAAGTTIQPDEVIHPVSAALPGGGNLDFQIAVGFDEALAAGIVDGGGALTQVLILPAGASLTDDDLDYPVAVQLADDAIFDVHLLLPFEALDAAGIVETKRL